jgi:hypothetical protein
MNRIELRAPWFLAGFLLAMLVCAPLTLTFHVAPPAHPARTL